MRIAEFRTLCGMWLMTSLGLAGCYQPSWRAEFINAGNDPVVIDVMSAWEPEKVLRSLKAPPQESVATRLAGGEALVVRDEVGDEVDRLENPFVHDHRYTYFPGPRRRRILHYLVLSTGIYPIPLEFLPEWEQHIDEIEAQQLVTPGWAQKR
jgi:hypothetical protein